MNKNNQLLIFAGLASAMLVGCADSAFNGVDTDSVANESTESIVFNSLASAKTRATRTTHEESAALLGNKFYVYGGKFNGTTESPIFDNYLVEYSANSGGSTESNSSDWEYAGKISKKGATQGVKYWDYSSDKYQFVAAAGIADDEFITNTTDGMRINVADAAKMTNIYVSNRITATPAEQTSTDTYPGSIAYAKTIPFQFRRLGAQMRIGFYEKVSGYAVKDLVFYYVGAASGSKNVGVGGAFPKSGKYTVTYDDVTNDAQVKFVGATNEMNYSNDFGKLDYTYAESTAGDDEKPYIDAKGNPSASQVNAFLGTSSAKTTFAKGTYTIDGTPNVESYYKPILPNESNSLKMQLRVDYTLVSLDGSCEEVHVRNAYVSVPIKYLKWKPNYSYTYIFKISDLTNGYTGDTGGDYNEGTGGYDPDPDNPGGGDNDPEVDPSNPGEVIPPYIPDPSYPEIDNPDYDPTQPEDPDTNPKTIPDPDAPLIPNPNYPDGPSGDQHDPSNPVPGTGTDPSDDDPTNPQGLYPITFDAVVIESDENTQETITIVSTPSITTYAEGSDVTTNDEYKVNEKIICSASDGVTPTAWDYNYSASVVYENDAKTMTSWTTLGTGKTATLTPDKAGYYTVRLTTADGVGYKVVKVVE